MQKAILVGALFLIGLAALTVITVGLTEWTPGGYTFTVRFRHVSGLDKQHPVFYRGYKIGKIKDIQWERKGTLLVGVRIQEDVEIPENAGFLVEDSNFFGGKLLTILDPAFPSPKNIEHEGAILEGGVQTQPLLKLMKEAAEDIRDIATIGKENLPDAITSLREVLDAIAESRGTLGKFINDPAAYEKIESILNDLNTLSREVSDEAFIGDVKRAAEKLREILEQIEEADVGRTIGKVGDLAERADRLIRQVEDGPGTAHRLIYNEELIRDWEAIFGKLAQGEGTIGRLLMDDSFYYKMEATVGNLNAGIKEARGLLAKMESTESSVGKLLDSSELHDEGVGALRDIRETLGVAARTWLAVGLSYRHAFEQELGIGKLYIRLIPRESRYFLVGGSLMNPSRGGPILFDEQDRAEGKAIFQVDVQVAQLFFFNRDDLNEWNDIVIGLRGGLIEGKPGGGIDVDFLAQTCRFTVEARDTHTDPDHFDERIDRYLLRSELSVRVWRYFRFFVGVDNIVEDAGFLVGGQIEWFDEDIKGLVSLLSTAF